MIREAEVRQVIFYLVLDYSHYDLELQKDLYTNSGVIKIKDRIFTFEEFRKNNIDVDFYNGILDGSISIQSNNKKNHKYYDIGVANYTSDDSISGVAELHITHGFIDQ